MELPSQYALKMLFSGQHFADVHDLSLNVMPTFLLRRSATPKCTAAIGSNAND